MALSLNKGGNLSLTKTDPNLTKLLIGLGWDERATSGAEFDLDASVFLLSTAGKVRGDDEVVKVNLTQVPADVDKIVVTVTIHDAAARSQNFGQVANAFIRVVNEETGTEVVRFDLAEDYSVETAMVFGEVYRHNGEWKFRAVGQGYSGGLQAMCQQYGVDI